MDYPVNRRPTKSVQIHTHVNYCIQIQLHVYTRGTCAYIYPQDPKEATTSLEALKGMYQFLPSCAEPKL